jgi:LysR family glycine cleavage system transcriptional activator
MNWSNLPPLSSLRAFAALAETESYSQAGKALNVTHGAVIQQVRSLEERLGVTLVVREGRGMKLTQEGASLAHDLAVGFASIFRGVETLTDADPQRPVQVSMSPAFATSWLMPRLADFQKRHPDITLLLNPTSDLVELKPGGIDLAIRYKDQSGSKESVDTVLLADMVVVGTPSLIGDRKITHAAQLIDLPWLQELGTNEVADWMAMHGVRLDRPLIISHMPGNLIMEAVRRGDGITYTARPFVDEEIRSGRLVELFSEPAFGIYYIKTRLGVLRHPVKIFVQWLKQQAAEG